MLENDETRAELNNVVYELNLGETESPLMPLLVSEMITKKPEILSNASSCSKNGNYYTAKETIHKSIKYYHKENVNISHKYIGSYMEYCSYLNLNSIYEDDKSCLLYFTLHNVLGDRLSSFKSAYLLFLNKADKSTSNATITEDINVFAGFPTFMDTLKYYRPISLRLYTCAENPEKMIAFDFKRLIPKEITTYIKQYIWTIMMAGIHKEHYKHNGKKEDLYFREYSSYNVEKGKSYTKLPTNLIRIDQYAGSYYNNAFISKLGGKFLRYGIHLQLPLIAAMLRHNSKVIDDHLDEVGGMVWDRLMSLLKEDGRFDEETVPQNMYRQYIKSQNNLQSTEDYLKAIENQLDRHLYYALDYKEDTSKAVAIYTFDNNVNSGQGTLYKLELHGYRTLNGYHPKPISMMTKNSLYLGYKKTELINMDTMYTQINGCPLPNASFDIEEYKGIIKSEYELIPEIRELMEKQWEEKGQVESEDLWTMVIFDDYLIAFYLGCKEIEYKTANNSSYYLYTHEFLTLSGNKLSIKNSISKAISDKLCHITEKDYKDADFRKNYPKLSYMYEKGYMLYHDYLLYGEKNPMADILKDR